MAEQRKKKKKHRVFWFFIGFQIFLMIILLSGLAYYYYGGYAAQVDALKQKAKEEVSASREADFIPSQKVTVYDAQGNIITERKPERTAEYVEYQDIPAYFVDAMISIEDKRYYSHNGVDYKAVIRAVKAMVDNSGEATQGASTITMQLGKLMFMDASNRTWQYKVEQMFVALELEKRYSKNKIMEFYLNNIYFSNGYYGISSAAQGYFNCDISDLSLSQIAYLCAIPNSPNYYDPLINPEHTLQRRDRILKNMRDDGIIDEKTYQATVDEEIVLNQPASSDQFANNYVDTYTFYCATRIFMAQQGFEFKDYFENDEEEALYKQLYEEIYESCQKELYTGGYKIYTSFDLTKQQELQNALDTQLKGFTEQTDGGVYAMQGSATCIDNETGYVVAIVGGRKQNLSTYTLNRAYQSHRQPGSAIKPILVYTPAFENGYTPDSVINDHKFDGGPSNAGDAYWGDVSLRNALAFSLNTVAWQLYEELTPEVGLSYLKAMHFSAISPDDYIPATAIGGFTNGASTLEMCAGFATVENDGYYRDPTCIVKIVDSQENIVYSSDQLEKKIYEETACRMTTSCLQSVMQDGTGKGAALDGIPCAGKTGTTNDNKDGWFVGYTKYYTTAVWVGYDYPKKIDDLSGSSYPAAIWKQYMQKIHEGLPVSNFMPYETPEDEKIDIFYKEEENIP